MKNKNKIWYYPFLVMTAILILTTSCEKKEDPSGTMTDGDGNVYTSVTIGTQVWLVENLKTTKYNDGTDIPLVTDDVEWVNLNTPGYCWYDNDAATYKNPYGALYNWYAVNTGKLCPTGWHVPTDAEWTILTTYLGGTSVAGGKLKELGTTHWTTPNTGSTNETGFTALPGGLREVDGLFFYCGNEGFWWNSPEYMVTDALYYTMYFNYNFVYSSNFNKRYGLSVRCLKN